VERRDPVVADLGEDRLVAGILATFSTADATADAAGRSRPDGLLVGPGDDAAVLDLAGPVVVCTDTLVEGQDFRRDWVDARLLGVKLAAQNLADVAAMGGRPLALLVCLVAPGDLPVSFITELAQGLDEECRRAGARVIGGDVSAGDVIVLAGTALGVLDGGGPAVLRSGARPGDRVALAGTPGRAAAGLALLEAGRRPSDVPAAPAAPLIGEQLAPCPDYPAGAAARAAGATALIDTSDGLLRDATRLAVASGVQLVLRAAALGEDAELRAAAGGLGLDPAVVRDWQLTGGEDHALLGCFPPQADLPAGFRVIGEVRAASPDAGPDVVVTGEDGAPIPGRADRLGYTHWARSDLHPSGPER